MTEPIINDYESKLFRDLSPEKAKVVLPLGLIYTKDEVLLHRAWKRVINSLPVTDTYKEELKEHTKLWKYDEERSTYGTTALFKVAVQDVPYLEFYGNLVGYQTWIEWTASSKHSVPITIKWEDVPEG